jgi:tubulin-folding cofactor B
MLGGDGVKQVLDQVQYSSGETRDAIINYVKGETGMNQSDDLVRITVSHSNLKAKFIELRFDKHMLIEDVYVKCCHNCGGGSADTVMLQLFDPIGNFVAQMDDMQKPFGFYGPENGYGIHVQDSDPNSLSAGGWLEDVSLVKKYEMSDEDYDKREGTVRKWMQSKKAADPTWTLEKEMMRRRDPTWEPPAPKPENYQQDEAGLVEMGSRCEVNPGGRRGEVKFVGKVEGLQPGWWAGIQLDDPASGSSVKNGVVKGVTYFECPEPYGTFVRPANVVCGDFPNELDELENELGEI